MSPQRPNIIGARGVRRMQRAWVVVSAVLSLLLVGMALWAAGAFLRSCTDADISRTLGMLYERSLGSDAVKVEPSLGALLAQTEPPCASTIDRAMARPMPEPPLSRLREESAR